MSTIIRIERRFIFPIIIITSILFYASIFIITGLTPSNLTTDQFPLIPGPSYTDLLLIMFIPFGYMIAIFYIGKYLVVYFLYLHKALKLKRYDYFIVSISVEKEMTGFKIVRRAIIPGLLAVNVAILIALNGSINHLIYTGDTTMPNYIPVVIEIGACLIGMPIACLIIIPIWIIESSGIMCSLNQKKYKNPTTPDIESVGRYYSSFIQGMTGISTIASYSLILYTYFQRTNDFSSAIIMVFIDPITIILFMVPISVLLEYKIEDIKKRVILSLEKKDYNINPQVIKIEQKN